MSAGEPLTPPLDADTAAAEPDAGGAAPAKRGLRRRLLAPLAAQLTQGVSPEVLARTLAVGAGCSMFPFLGTTSLLNLVVGLGLRMNQPVLQTLNQVLGPVHLVMIVVYVRVGERLVGATGSDRFSVVEVVTAFRDLSLGDFFARFGRAGLHALLAWGVTLPLLVGGVYLVARPLVAGFAAGMRRARTLRGNSEDR